MSSRVYETAVIINAALDDPQVESVISQIKDTIINNGGEIREIENWGRKRLAYMIKKSKVGYYLIIRFNASPNLISKLERSYQLDEHILRYLTIKLDADALEQIEKSKALSVEEPGLPAEVVSNPPLELNTENESQDRDQLK
ncbi:MAG: 30S ribosomal protein S6 [Ignavibacteria bacterium]